MRALIVANGELPSLKILSRAISRSDFVLAADGGANRLEAAGCAFNAVLGDFDSISPDILRGAVPIEAPDQNFTDLDKAVAYLLAQGYNTITMTAVGGERIDHTFGALSVLVKYGRLVDLILLDDFAEARLVDKSVSFETEPGQTISLLPLTPSCNIFTTGLKWNLNGEDLTAGIRDGISNEAIESLVSISVESGDLVAYVHHWK
jgi:thiamine pyrophosphokinase